MTVGASSLINNVIATTGVSGASQLESMTRGASTAELTLRMGLALVTVLLLLWGITALVRRRNGGVADGPRILIRHQQQLSKHTTLTLLTAGAEHLLIASNNSETTLLASGPILTGDPNEVPDTDGANPRAGSGTRAPASGRAGRPAKGSGSGAGPSAAARRAQIDIRSRSGPLKQLQEKTVRRG